MKRQRITLKACLTLLGAATIAATTATMSAAAPGGERVGDPYTLTTCPISGGALGSMGEPVVNLYDGREVRFCCAPCIGKFEKDLEASFTELDAQIAADQAPYYPLDTCVISGEALGDEYVNVVVGNRLVRTCCQMCEKKVRANPEPYIKAVNEAAIAQQREHYPLDTCVVMEGEPLVEADVEEVVIGGRLARLCCKMCKRKIKKQPTEFIVAIDKAWSEQGGFKH